MATLGSSVPSFESLLREEVEEVSKKKKEVDDKVSLMKLQYQSYSARKTEQAERKAAKGMEARVQHLRREQDAVEARGRREENSIDVQIAKAENRIEALEASYKASKADLENKLEILLTKKRSSSEAILNTLEYYSKNIEVLLEPKTDVVVHFPPTYDKLVAQQELLDRELTVKSKMLSVMEKAAEPKAAGLGAEEFIRRSQQEVFEKVNGRLIEKTEAQEAALRKMREQAKREAEAANQREQQRLKAEEEEEGRRRLAARRAEEAAAEARREERQREKSEEDILREQKEKKREEAYKKFMLQQQKESEYLKERNTKEHKSTKKAKANPAY